MCVPQLPQLSRLGLLAVALSNGRVVLYTLPHPEALQALKRTQVKGRKSGVLAGGSWAAQSLPPGTWARLVQGFGEAGAGPTEASGLGREQLSRLFDLWH